MRGGESREVDGAAVTTAAAPDPTTAPAPTAPAPATAPTASATRAAIRCARTLLQCGEETSVGDGGGAGLGAHDGAGLDVGQGRAVLGAFSRADVRSAALVFRYERREDGGGEQRVAQHRGCAVDEVCMLSRIVPVQLLGGLGEPFEQLLHLWGTRGAVVSVCMQGRVASVSHSSSCFTSSSSIAVSESGVGR